MIEWNEFPRVNLAFMDQDHEACLELIAALLEVLSEDNLEEAIVTEKLNALKAHFIEHFKREEQAMEDTGFPPYYVHKTEHDSVLQQFDQVVQEWNTQKDIKSLTRYIDLNLTNWLETHALTMDSVTAAHISRHS